MNVEFKRKLLQEYLKCIDLYKKMKNSMINQNNFVYENFQFFY